MVRLFLYFRPHLVAVPLAVGFAWVVKTLASMGGACRFLCYPPVTVAMGVLGGLMGAQLYRSENPLPPRGDV
jgi:hypothetical protein